LSIELRKLKKIEKVTFFFLSNYPTKVYTNLNIVSSNSIEYRVKEEKEKIETITAKYIVIFRLMYYNFVD